MACPRILLGLVSISLVCACTSKESVLPQDGPTMLDIYYGHFDGRPPTPETGGGETPSGGGADRRQHAVAAARDMLTQREAVTGIDLAAYTRNVETETQQLFPTLPNPQIVLYVFPHLSGPERLPVPGYSTAFPLYPRIEYSLPGETLLPQPPADAEDRILVPPTGPGEHVAARQPSSAAAGR